MSAKASGPVEQFVTYVRRRVNLHRLWTTLVWTVVAGAALLAALGVVYVGRGHAVPGAWIAGAIGLAAMGGGLAWLGIRLNIDQTARFADRFYGLQDSVASYLHFSRQKEQTGYHELQAEYTRRQVQDLSPTAIPYQAPRGGLMLAAGLVAIALPLSLRGPSEAVLQQLEQEKAVHAASMLANEELRELVDQLREGVDDPFEKELLDPDKLRQMVDRLEATKDQKEALRQYAQLERELNKVRMAVQRKNEEQLLDRAAEELDQQRETKALAQQLREKKYNEAAKQLAEMAPVEGKTLSEQRRQLARLKAASQRMAAAAQASRASSQSSASRPGSESASSSSNAKGTSGTSENASGAPNAGSDGELSDNLERLAQAVRDLDDSLKKAERQESEFGQCDSKSQSQCQSCEQAVDQQLNKLCENLSRLAIRRRVASKLSRLCEKCSQCQGGLCTSLAQIPNPNAGGKKAGWGSNTSRRDASDPLVDNGQTTQLKGIKGAGPSQSTVESAEEGSAVSHRRSVAKQREFQRQFESFVAREDVPTQVRNAVKNYFQLIHQIESTPADNEDVAE